MKSHIDDSVITCDEIVDIAETVTSSNDKKDIYKMDYYILHNLLLIIILLLIIVSICCYCIKRQSKENNIFPYQ